jgi:hypothetical protein
MYERGKFAANSYGDSSGKPLWHLHMGGSVYAAPIAFAVDGKQYVGIAAGSAVCAFGLP